MAFERLHPGTSEWTAYYGNHLARYRFAAATLRAAGARKVLDAACGVGYGSRHLAEALPDAEIVAVDRSEEALAIARAQFAHTRVRHLQDDCLTLAAAAAHAPFDAVVSMETLEHLPDQPKFLAVCRERLRPGGQLLVSTPNKHLSAPDKDWSFHEKELTAAEFAHELGHAGYAKVELLSQDYTELGRFRMEVRGELQRLRSLPFARLGRWLQRTLRGRVEKPLLPERPEEFAFAPLGDPAACDARGAEGPLILMGLATR